MKGVGEASRGVLAALGRPQAVGAFARDLSPEIVDEAEDATLTVRGRIEMVDGPLFQRGRDGISESAGAAERTAAEIERAGRAFFLGAREEVLPSAANVAESHIIFVAGGGLGDNADLVEDFAWIARQHVLLVRLDIGDHVAQFGVVDEIF